MLALFEKLKVQRAIRLLGVGVSHLVRAGDARPPAQALLFPEMEPQAGKKDRSLDQAVDRLRQKLGPDAIKRGNWKAGERRPP